MSTTQEQVDSLVLQLTEAREAYYNSDEPLLSDGDFDNLEEQLRDLAPQHAYFRQVGTSVNLASTDALLESGKIKHKKVMRSLDKVKKVEELLPWLKRLDLPDIEFILEPKVDGISATLFYKEGQLQYIATRGDGEIGQNISHLASYCDSIPSQVNLKGEFEVRGELYLPKNTAFDIQNKPLRNNCSGLINRKEKREDSKYIHLVAYQMQFYSEELREKFRYESDKLKCLKRLGFLIPQVALVNNYESIQQKFVQYLEDLRTQWPYETDGMVLCVNDNKLHEAIDARWVVDHHHHFAIAIKPPSVGGVTRLKEIEWNISRLGMLVPTAIFEPLMLGGAKIERATLNNYQNVLNLHLQIGDELFVERANDVIPFVSENLSANHLDTETVSADLSPVTTPTICPSCGGLLEEKGVHLVCSNITCPEMVVKQIVFWIKQRDMKNIAEKTIKTLVDNQLIKSITDLYRIKADDLYKLEGFQEKKVTNFIQEQQAAKSMSVSEFIVALGIPLVQKKSVRKLNIQSMTDFYEFNDADYVIGQNLIRWRDQEKNKILVQELVAELDIYDDVFVESNELKIVATGKAIVNDKKLSREELKRYLQALDYSLNTSVTKDVSLVLCDDVDGTSSKLEKARKFNISISSYQDFFTQHAIEI